MSSVWKNRTVLITSGPTREFLDPIRFLSNASSGRMGYALAAEARRLGARVWVVSGPSLLPPPRGVRVIAVVTALQMRRRVLALAAKADVVIAAAAVSDWRFAARASRKLRRSGPLRLTLIPNPDIIKEVGRRRTSPRQVLVGFALETTSGLKAVRAKMEKKGLDLIVANGPSSLAGGRSRAVILGRSGARALPEMSKRLAARAVLREVGRLLAERPQSGGEGSHA